MSLLSVPSLQSEPHHFYRYHAIDGDDMIIKELSEDFSVSGQLAPTDLGTVFLLGYEVVIDNRFDGEEADQPDSTTLKQAADELDIDFHYLPTDQDNFDDLYLESLESILTEAKKRGKRVLAFCRSGTRSACGWALMQAKGNIQSSGEIRQHVGSICGKKAEGLVAQQFEQLAP